MTSTLDQLAQLPELAAERFLTIGAPNPSPEAGRGAASITPTAPADLEAYDVLRADDKGQLHRLSRCVRTVLETMREQDHDDHPDPGAEATWVGECDWLTHTADWWQLDPWCCEWVTGEVDSIWRTLRHAVREPRRAAFVCPTCGDRATMDGHWLACESGHEVSVRDHAQQLMAREPIGTTDIAAEMGISVDRIYKWRERGLVKPALVVGKAHLWKPWDIFKQLYPLLAKDLQESRDHVS